MRTSCRASAHERTSQGRRGKANRRRGGQARRIARRCRVARCSRVAGCSGCTAAPASAAAAKPVLSERKTLTYPTVGAGILWNFVPGLIAEAKGFFNAENLTVNVVAAQSSAEGCQNLIARAAEIGGCSINDMIQVVETSGAPLIEFMAFSGTALQYSVMTKKELTTWPQLKGKTVMVGGPKDNTVFYFRTMARANGLQDTDYDFQFAGASAARFAALKTGAVDASILTDPFDFQAEQEGFPKLDQLLPKYLNDSTYSGGGPVRPSGLGQRSFGRARGLYPCDAQGHGVGL